jgi:hypothetical protein
MSKCKHNRLPDRVKDGSLPRVYTQYYCTQCQSWIPAEQINREADRRKKEDEENMDKFKEKWKGTQ